MDRAEAQAIYDSGREACVEFILELAGGVGEHEDRLSQLEQQARQDSRTQFEAAVAGFAQDAGAAAGGGACEGEGAYAPRG